MTNYENDTLDLIPGDTPRKKYEWVKKILLDEAKYTEADMKEAFMEHALSKMNEEEAELAFQLFIKYFNN